MHSGSSEYSGADIGDAMSINADLIGASFAISQGDVKKYEQLMNKHETYDEK